MKPIDLLIVEDNPADLDIIKRYLRKIKSWEFDVRASCDFASAMKVINEFPPELIMLDHKLPDKNGLQLLEEFQTEDSYIPVIMLTGAGNESFVSRAIRRGADDYIAKEDLSLESLQESIKHVIGEFYEKMEKNLKLLAFELKSQSTRDELTGLHDRSALVKKLSREINLSDGTDSPLSLLFLDLDNFKAVNDRKGHVIGDKLLKRVANELSSSVRKQDFVARYGGDEFCVLLPRTGVDSAELVARKIVNRMDESFHDWLSEQRMALQLSVSVGLAELTDSTNTVEDLIDSADRAMYRAKENGGGGITSI